MECRPKEASDPEIVEAESQMLHLSTMRDSEDSPSTSSGFGAWVLFGPCNVYVTCAHRGSGESCADELRPPRHPATLQLTSSSRSASTPDASDALLAASIV